MTDADLVVERSKQATVLRSLWSAWCGSFCEGLGGNMNVRKEADAQFMRLLKQEDPQRYENLTRNMRQSSRRNNNMLLVARRYATMAERDAARREATRLRVERLRQRKTALQIAA